MQSLQACLQANACIWGITDTESERSGDEVPVMCRRKPAGLSVATSQAHASLQACLQAGWSKSDGIGRNAPTGSLREASRLGENWRNRKSAPTGSHREASRFGKNWQNRKNAPTGSLREASRLGENWWNRENAPTGSLREASRLGENWRNRENAPIGR